MHKNDSDKGYNMKVYYDKDNKPLIAYIGNVEMTDSEFDERVKKAENKGHVNYAKMPFIEVIKENDNIYFEVHYSVSRTSDGNKSEVSDIRYDVNGNIVWMAMNDPDKSSDYATTVSYNGKLTNGFIAHYYCTSADDCTHQASVTSGYDEIMKKAWSSCKMVACVNNAINDKNSIWVDSQDPEFKYLMDTLLYSLVESYGGDTKNYKPLYNYQEYYEYFEKNYGVSTL